MSRKTRKRNRIARAQTNNNNAAVETIGVSTGENDAISKALAVFQNLRMKVVSLDSSVLELDMGYQRETKPEEVQEIINKFDPAVVNILKVSARDGRYFVFDGGHTLAALKEINGTDSFPVLCQVFYGLTFEDEATLFAKQRGEARAVGVPQKLHALEAAKDKSATDFLERTRRSGFEINPKSSQVRDGKIAAVKKAYDVYQQIGPEQYEAMLTLIKTTWQGDSWSVNQNMLGGMSLFWTTYADEFKRDRFVSRLKGVNKMSMGKEASKHYSVSSAVAHAFAIVKFYNHPGGKGTLNPMKLTTQV